MLRELLKREPGWKYAPYAALAAGAIWPFILLHSAKPEDSNLLVFFIIILQSGWGAPLRASPFEAALPIPGRQLVAARTIARQTMLWLGSLAMIAETIVFRGWEHAGFLVMFPAMLSFASLLGQSTRVHEARPPLYGYLLGFAACLLLGAPFHLSETTMSAILLAASAALAMRLWLIVPQGFQLAPAKLRREGWFNPRRWFPWRLRPWPWWLAWRSTLRAWGHLTLPVAVFLYCGVWLGSASMVIPAAAVRSRVEWLALLPISRRRLLLMMVFPWILIPVAFPFLAARFGSAPKPPFVSTGYAESLPGGTSTGSGTPNVLVPATYWHWAVDDDGSVIYSPWGEETHPRIYLRLGLPFYNPYSVAPDNSPRFLEWQFARATQAVYGRSVPLAQASQLRSQASIPVSRQLRTQCTAALGAALVFLGMLLLTFWFKAGGGGCLTSFVWFLFLLPFAGDLFTASALRESGSLSEILSVRFAAILPQSWVALLSVELLLVAVLYLALERQFQRVELAASLRRLERKEQRRR